MADRAAQQGANARQNLFEMERLGDVIVGAGIEALHLVAPAVARREHEHRHYAPVTPPGFQHRDAIHLRQTDVEDDGVVRLAVAEEMSFLAVKRAVDDVTGVGQRGGELAIKIGVVLDDEEGARAYVSGLLTPVDEFAAAGVNGQADYFATAPQQSQHIDQGFVLAAKPGPD